MNQFIQLAYGLSIQQRFMTLELKEKAKKEYFEALKMPRKKKKQAKKSALMLYNIACWREVEFTF